MRQMVRSPLFLMALTVFIDFMGFGMIIPLLPFWAENLGASPVGVGLALTSYALVQFVCTPLLGGLSDRFGRRPVLVASLVIESLAFALTALAGSLPLLIVARGVGGLGASNIGTAQAVVADVLPPEQRARGMGAIGAAIGLGFVVGPALGDVLAGLGPTLPFWVAMGLALVNILLVLRFLPETRQVPSASTVHVSAGSWRQIIRIPAVLMLVGIGLLYSTPKYSHPYLSFTLLKGGLTTTAPTRWPCGAHAACFCPDDDQGVAMGWGAAHRY